MAEKNWWHTPLGISMATLIIGSIISYIGFSGLRQLQEFDNHFTTIDAHIQRVEDKADEARKTMFSLLSTVKDKETNDILVLSKGVSKCCPNVTIDP